MFPEAIRPLAKSTHTTLPTAASPLFSLAHQICDTPRDHLSDHAAQLDEHGLLPELTGLAFLSDFVDSEEEALITRAVEKSRDIRKQSDRHRKQLRENLDAATDRLTKTLTRKNGLLWLLRHGLKKSKKFAKKFQGLADHLEVALSSPPPTSEVPWEEARRWFARLATAVELQLLLELDTVLKATAPRTQPTKATQPRRATPKRQSIKDAFLRSWDGFLQAHTATQIDTAESDALPLWILCSGLIASLTDRLKEAGLNHTCESSPRLIDAIATLDERIISRQLLEDWNKVLGAADSFTMQLVLALLHHLERPDDEAAEPVAHGLIYSFSEGTAARWFSRGDYPGALPEREASVTFAAEKKRTRRQLEDLRRHTAAFHGRHQWTPLVKKVSDSASDRLWTVNPLLAAHAGIRLEANRPPAAASPESRDDRRRPARRNRRAQRKR